MKTNPLTFLLALTFLFLFGCHSTPIPICDPLKVNCGSLKVANVVKMEKTKESDLVKTPHTIMGGLSYSFDLLYSELDHHEFILPTEIKKFGEAQKIDSNEFFPIVTLRFTALTGKLLTIQGLKAYPSTPKFKTNFPCYDDYSTLSETLKSKYPSLKKFVPFLARQDKDVIGMGLAERLDYRKSSFETMGSFNPKGRFLKLQCIRGGPRSILSIDYWDTDRSKLAVSERKDFLKLRNKDILKQKGIDPDKL